MQSINLANLEAKWRIAVEQRWLLVSGAALLYGLVETVSLAAVHHDGPEIQGVIVAATTALAGLLNVALLRLDLPRTALRIAGVALLALWAVIAVGGIAGFIAHLGGVGIDPGFVDPRPKPIAAPLVFTLVGVVGAAALVLGQRARERAGHTS